MISNPVINSPFKEPSRHFELTEDGTPTGVILPNRRGSEHLVSVRAPGRRRRAGDQVERGLEGQDTADFEVSPNNLVNEIRRHVGDWRRLPPQQWGVTPETARLLAHWRSGQMPLPPFFCQVEAVETMVWLTEVAPKRFRGMIEDSNAEANPGLYRLALKMATGSGKTTVMAMLIAWHAVNKARHPGTETFSDAFLIVTPGITIRDRLRVLLPSDPQNYYETRQIVPRDMLEDLRRARVVITNYHAFQVKEKVEVKALARELLGGRQGPKSFKESDAEMIARVCKDLIGRPKVLVLNDEAHHCYRHKQGESEEGKLTGDEKSEAKKNEEAARLWINGIEALGRTLRRGKRKGGIAGIYDLSATPFFLRGSGYGEGKLFPWVVSDFSLMDAIESGIVKVPRVPVASNQGVGDMPVLRDLYQHIKDRLPKAGRHKQDKALMNPDGLPPQLENAITALYEHYEATSRSWSETGQETPPVFIVVCNNTSTSKLVYDYISGYEVDDGKLRRGRLPLFSNVDDHGTWLPLPRTLLIDSEQLDSGDALKEEFKNAVAPLIEDYRAEVRRRFPDRDVSKITDADLLREVMNTIGKPGKLGESIRCVVSVSMLTEGWDANTVTHILGVRAFGTQLLCEQVVGRGLRRLSYDLNEDGRFDAEYAEIVGVPFSFVSSSAEVVPQPPKPKTHVHSIEARSTLKIVFPRLVGYRHAIPPDRLNWKFTEESKYVLDPGQIGGTRTEMEAIVGEGITLNIDQLREIRMQRVAFEVAGLALRTRFKDAEDNLKPWLFPQLLHATKEWLDDHVQTREGTPKQLFLWKHFAERAVEKVFDACFPPESAASRQIRPILDPYNPVATTAHVDFYTSRQTLIPTVKSQVSHVVYDKDWEANLAEKLEGMTEVVAYVKNHALHFEVPYVLHGLERAYLPDYVLRVDDGQGADDLLNLIVEVKGFRGEDAVAKAETMTHHWVPAVNNHGGFGRWAFLEIRELYDQEERIREFLRSRRMDVAA